jgi:hypothetical protein
MHLSIPLLLAAQLGASVAAPLQQGVTRRAPLSEAASLSLRDTTVVVRRPVTRVKRSKGAVAGVAAAKAQAQAPPVAAAAAAGGAAGGASPAGGASAAACAAPAAAAGAGAEAAAAEGGEGEGEGEEEEVLVDAAFGDIVEIAGTDIKTDVLFTPTVRHNPRPTGADH